MEPHTGTDPVIREQPPVSPDDPRVVLAAERTLLAWLRTGLAMMGFGFLVAKFGLFLREIVVLQGGDGEQSSRLSMWIGAAMVVLGVVATFVAGVEHLYFLRGRKTSLARYRLRSSMGVASAMVLAGIGVIMVVYLVSL